MKGQPVRFLRGHVARLGRCGPPRKRITVETYAVDENGCHIWLGPVNNNGYGRIGPRYAHRDAWEDAHGSIPEGMEIDHLCRVRRCVNAEHMDLVTGHTNALRSPLRTKLSDAQVADLRSRVGRTDHIAAEFGISPSYASRLRRGERRVVSSAA